MFLLDTNICSAHLKRPGGLAHRFLQHSGRLYVSVIVVAELYAGAYMLPQPERLLSAIVKLLEELVVLDFDMQSARQFGILRAELRSKGVSVSPMDLLIAATARRHQFVLVTHNTADFEAISGLTWQDWLDK
jgi:tRNA(fMet)-specific endonuclease VapC